MFAGVRTWATGAAVDQEELLAAALKTVEECSAGLAPVIAADLTQNDTWMGKCSAVGFKSTCTSLGPPQLD